MADLGVAVVDYREPSLADGDLEAEMVPLPAVDVLFPLGPDDVDSALPVDLVNTDHVGLKRYAGALRRILEPEFYPRSLGPVSNLETIECSPDMRGQLSF